MQVPLLTIIETHEIYNLKIQLFRKEKEIVFLYPLKKKWFTEYSPRKVADG